MRIKLVPPAKSLFLCAGLVFLLFATGCRFFLKPHQIEPEETVLVEETSGNYTFQDSTDTYTGRFLLFADGNRLSIDLFALYFAVASIRHNPDSTLLYLPVNAQVIILGNNDYLPLEGWEVPIAPLASAYKGELPEEPDSTIISGDTVLLWKDNTCYLELPGEAKVAGLRGPRWELWREGLLKGVPKRNRASRIVFRTDGTELILEFLTFQFSEQQCGKIFTLNLPENIKILDYR